MTSVENFNNQSLGEEIANAIFHGIGALLGVAGTVVLIVNACLFGTAVDIVSGAIYGASLIILYTMSTLYHSMTKVEVKKVFQVFDHCSVFLLIMGSYVPICLSLLGGRLGYVLFGVNLLCMTLGIVANAVDVRKWHKVSLVMYLIMGWSALFALKPIIEIVGLGGFLLLFLGGVLYSIGVLFYRSERKGMHPIWHLFVLSGSILHYFFILHYIIT